MVEATEGAEGGVDDVPALGPRDIDDEPHTAGVVLEGGIVETARRGQCAEWQRSPGQLLGVHGSSLLALLAISAM